MFVTILPTCIAIAVLALDAVVPLDLAIPAQVFGTYDEAPYTVTVCAPAPMIQTTAGFTITAQAGLEALLDADTVIVPGFVDHLVVPPDACSKRCARRPARMVSICTGAFALAAAGRAGRPPRDHALARRRGPRRALPAGARRPGRALRRRGRRADLGRRGLRHGPVPAHPPPRPRRRDGRPDRAADRRPAAPRRRPGAVRRATGPGPSGRLAGRHPRVGLCAGLPIRSPSATSPRTPMSPSARSPAASRPRPGCPSCSWLLAQRLDAARAALETTDASVDEIADACGFGSAANLRKHFHRAVSTTPTAYRRTFALVARRSWLVSVWPPGLDRR